MEKILEDYSEVFKHYSEEQLIKLKEWLSDYIVPLDSDITWLNLTNEEYQEFLKENYVDSDNNNVMWSVSWLPTVLGMYYLNFFNTTGFNYLIGVIPNKIGKKTIVASLCYEKNRIWDINQERPVNSIQTIEVNTFYRRQGLFKVLASKIIDCIDIEQDLVITDEQDDGLWFHTVDRIKKILRDQGYDNDIFTHTEFNQRKKKNK